MQCWLCERDMSITTGLGMGERRCRSRLPSVQAVSEVKCGKTRELSMRSISSTSRGGRGISVVIFWEGGLWFVGFLFLVFREVLDWKFCSANWMLLLFYSFGIGTMDVVSSII